MKTIIFIHGGESFETHEEFQKFLENTYIDWQSEHWTPEEKTTWVKEIAKKWHKDGGVVYMPVFPNKLDSKYNDWKIVFKGIISRLDNEDEIALIGGSLGGCFLLKYFSELNSENSPFVIPTQEESASGGNGTDSSQAQNNKKIIRINSIHLVAACIKAGDFSEPKDYTILQSLGNKVHIWHAEDDTVVPFSVGQELTLLLPQAQTHFFGSEKGYGHFYKLENFPELEKVLKISHL